MANYLRPGVYVEESLTPLTSAISSPGESVSAFVGIHTKGPTVPTLITSWSQFLALYGTFSPDPTLYLAHSVFQFFNNGGRAAWLVRAANANATPATVALNDLATTPLPLISFTALNPGVAGNSLYVTTTKADADQTGASDTRFNLYIHEGSGAAGDIKERYTDLSMNPIDQRYAPTIVNSPLIGSSRVKIAHSGVTTWTLLRSRPVEVAGTALATGSDGTGSPDLVAATQLLETVDSVLTLNLPGVTDTPTLTSVVAWAAGTGRVFVVVDVPKASPTVDTTVTAYGTIPAGLGKSSYAAVYGPWVNVSDPATSARGSIRLVPPGGLVMGRYATTDATRGVQKPPAGIDVPLNGVLGLEINFKNSDLDILNQKNVNIIRSLPGAGFCIMGARTLASGTPDRYVSVRRSLIYIKKALLDGTRWAIFEPNDDDLWSTLSSNTSDFLTTLMQTHILRGNTPAQAYYVKCDAENNNLTSVANGEVNIEIGVALNSPAEFVIIKIGQFEGGGNAADDLSATV